jgi:Na+-translocating ferredoxin:NAD+ oxidoreductase RnfG subunit
MTDKRLPKLWDTILGVGVMAVLSVAVVLTVAAVRENAVGKFDEQITDLPQIAETHMMAADGYDLATFGITSVDECVDAAGNLVAYRLSASVTGYNQESPIEMATTISKDGTVLFGIEIIKQKESEYYGDRISGADFQNRLSGRYLPIFRTGEAGQGAHVDGLSGATVTTNAVFGAINQAHQCVLANFVEGENTDA